jgi:hypothetical protein
MVYSNIDLNYFKYLSSFSIIFYYLISPKTYYILFLNIL